MSPEARRPPKAPWQELQRHEIPQQKWTTAESRLLAHLVTQHPDAKGHPMWIRIAPLLNGRTPQACSGRCTRGCSHAHVGGCTPRMQGCNLMHDRLQPIMIDSSPSCEIIGARRVDDPEVGHHSRSDGTETRCSTMPRTSSSRWEEESFV